MVSCIAVTVFARLIAFVTGIVVGMLANKTDTRVHTTIIQDRLQSGKILRPGFCDFERSHCRFRKGIFKFREGSVRQMLFDFERKVTEISEVFFSELFRCQKMLEL